MVTEPAAPELSIVFALECARSEDPLEGVIAWARGQTCERHRYELIVASNGQHSDWERRLPEILTPLDRHVGPLPGLSDGALIDAGVRAARGRWIHLCEAHTIPEPDCAEEILAYVASHDVPGAVANAGTRGDGPIERAEARYYREVVGSRMRSATPPLAARGVTLRADLLAKAGGVPAGYSIFYEKALEAQLRELGVVLGFAERARFAHLEQDTLAGHREDVAIYVGGEHDYRRDLGDAFCDRHFGRPEIWAERIGYRRPFARLRARALAQASGRALRAGHPSAAARAAREAAREAVRAATGARGEIAAAALATGLAELRFRLAQTDERRHPHFLAVKRHATRLARLRDVGREARERGLTDPPPRVAFDACEMGDDELVGFHDRERREALDFRWSTPACVLRLALAPGDWDAAIVTGGLRGDLADAGLVVRFNDATVPARELRLEGDEIRFPLRRAAFAPGREQRLTLACAPVAVPPGSEERRRLGLPVSALRFTPR
jgi:hypothetical protein